jgi:hypothetical protein
MESKPANYATDRYTRRKSLSQPGASWRHDLDPQLYLTQLLVNLPALRISDLPAWLPDRWKAVQKTPPAASPDQNPQS